jgi:hypothetical protein
VVSILRQGARFKAAARDVTAAGSRLPGHLNARRADFAYDEGAATAGANSPGVWTQDDSGHVRTPLEPLVLAATLALIPVLILENSTSGAWQTAAFIGNWLIWAVFAFELAAVLVVVTRRGAALRAHWLDVAVVALTVPLYGQLLSSLRFFRFLRLLRAVGACLAGPNRVLREPG